MAGFIWDAQIIISPNSVYRRQNRPEQTHGWGKISVKARLLPVVQNL